MASVIIDYSPCFGYNLQADVIAWREEQSCQPAIRDVPMRTDGAYVDTSSYVLKARIIYMTVRLSDSQKSTLQNIYNNRTSGFTIVAEMDWDGYDEWYYSGCWFLKKPLIYEYKSRGGSDLREWRADLVFKVQQFILT